MQYFNLGPMGSVYQLVIEMTTNIVFILNCCCPNK